MNAKILVIDDEEALCEILKFNLEKAGYDVDCAYSAEEALEMDLKPYQLMIVDIMMESLSGFDFAKRIRNNPETEFTPIIFCSALNGEDDTVMGLNIGADDYITKPFVISEVLARVRAVLRRVQMVSKPEVAKENNYVDDVIFNGLRIDRNEKLGYLNGEELKLTRTEYAILKMLMRNPSQVVTKSVLLDRICEDTPDCVESSLKVHVSNLRRKLKNVTGKDYIEAVWGIGFKLRET